MKKLLFIIIVYIIVQIVNANDNMFVHDEVSARLPLKEITSFHTPIFLEDKDTIYINKEYIDSMLRTLVLTPTNFYPVEYSIIYTAEALSGYYAKGFYNNGIYTTSKSEIHNLIDTFNNNLDKVKNADIIRYINLWKLENLLSYFPDIFDLESTLDSIICERNKIRNYYKNGIEDTTICNRGYSIIHDSLLNNSEKLYILTDIRTRINLYKLNKYITSQDSTVFGRQLKVLDKYIDSLKHNETIVYKLSLSR